MTRFRMLMALLIISAAAVGASEPADTLTRFQGSYEAEFSGTLSQKGAHTPFWLVSNRGGLGSVRTDAGFVRGATHGMGRIDERWTWSFGADLVGSWRAEAPFFIRELYGGIRYRDFEFTAGSKLETDRLVDMRLSSGDLLFSGNAMPIPQLRLAMPDYLMISGTGGWLGFKAYFSFGKFTDNNWMKDFVRPGARYTRNVLYHTKGLRIRVGNLDKLPLTFEGGFEMASQFGGEIMKGDSVVQRLPHSFKDVIKVIFAQGGGGSELPGEQSNALGNHLGEWSARINWHTPGESMVSLYYLHFFEDHSMMTFDYTWHDGLWGLEFKLPANPFVSKVVYEYLYTKDQSGPVYWDHTPEVSEQVSGRDGYYNHYLYNGWQNWGMGIGNPLIISPVWNKDHSLAFQCNRVISHHIGLQGEPSPHVSWRILATYTRGWGTYSAPYMDVKRNVNFLGEVTGSLPSLKGWSTTVGIGVDRGSMLGRSYGGMLTIRKTGIL